MSKHFLGSLYIKVKQNLPKKIDIDENELEGMGDVGDGQEKLEMEEIGKIQEEIKKEEQEKQ